MHIIFSTIIKWEEIYKNQSKEDNDLISECNYTKELINILDILIVPIATLMNGAMKTLDLLQHLPWANFKLYTKKNFIMSPLLEKIEDILDKLNDPSLSCDDKSTNCSKFEILHKFFKSIMEDLQYEINTFCKFVPYNSNYLWNECIQEYRAFNNQGVQLIFFEFLTKKIKDYIRKTIIEKYFQLGFKFDPITEETFIPTPEELIELEEYSLKKTMSQLNVILQYPGWKNLNDLISIEYHKKKYYLESLIETPTHKEICEQQIRALTVYLGCTYAKVIKIIFSIIINWQKMYKEGINLINRCIYTEELINTIAIFIDPLATMLKGAMDTLDLLHHLPWAKFKMYHRKFYMMSPFLDNIGNIFDKLNDPSLSCNGKSTNSSKFEIVNSFSNKIITELDFETDTYCNFIPYDANYLWNQWVEEYRAINNHGVKLIFFEFLTRKIKDYIKRVIVEKYFKLGFNLDPITQETFIATPKELYELDLELKINK
ncbi:uncharacterized protein LOC126907190 [Daktulosphaira vitifoliae]|uniref:uncharacterized protein LOC126907190 n=1 Tax=Daktulosphaira vitifoliae TaxID=58002 RepID=UPI0021A9FB67|nr:uncharacterized protein LOC126907190 [Daktulosphaira vitifoliae]